MLDVLFKKKITEEKLTDYFVHSTIKMVDEGFPEIVEIIKYDPEFETPPQIDPEDSDKFLWIVIAGNLKFIPKYFNDYQDVRLLEQSMKKFSRVLDVPFDAFKLQIKKYHQFFARVNHPSKNTLYAMSKSVFYKYNLNPYQEEYFRNMNTPNPIFLKHLDEIMETFLFDWQGFIEKFRIVQR